MPRSLSLRFFFASLVLLPLLLGISAYSLDLAMRRSLLAGERDALQTQVYLLLGAADVLDGNLWMPEQFQEPRYNQPDSGLYAIIENAQQREVWRSPSALLLSLEPGAPTTAITPGRTTFARADSNQGPLFSLNHDIVWELTEGEDSFFRLTILHQQDAYLAELAGYRQQLWRWLGLLAAAVILVQTLILRWGLRPLGSLARDLRKIQTGDAEQLTGQYPTEIQPVTDNLNQVLLNERLQRDRYRTTLDDLAHSLKTPLAVMQSLAGEKNRGENNPDENNPGEESRIISDQVERMNQIVQHQLSRAVVGNIGISRQQIPVAPIVNRLLDSLQKVYIGKAISTRVAIDEQCRFNGEESDLMELLGNLLENAFKYGEKQVSITASSQKAGLEILIEDDGQGIAPSQRQTLLQRGARADTATPGQGIGLAVAIDIVSSYQGSLEIDSSSLGGALFRLILP